LPDSHHPGRPCRDGWKFGNSRAYSNHTGLLHIDSRCDAMRRLIISYAYFNRETRKLHKISFISLFVCFVYLVVKEVQLASETSPGKRRSRRSRTPGSTHIRLRPSLPSPQACQTLSGRRDDNQKLALTQAIRKITSKRLRKNRGDRTQAGYNGCARQ
jgi:hypothetical protein